LTGREITVHFDKTRDPLVNLKRETELFAGVDSGALPECLRFWVNSPCLVRGRAKNANYGWYNAELAAQLGVPVIERSTGGGVVYHDEGNLNWSFFFRTSGGFLSPTTSFDQASKYIIAALGRLGIQAKFSPPNRIDVFNRKVSGMAARSTIHAFLVHGTLLLNSDLEKLNRLCIPPPGCPPVSNLCEWAPNVDAPAVVRAVVDVLTDSGFHPRTAT
jgi:lipoate-protein ligase A